MGAHPPVYAAIDIGAGIGAKLGLFGPEMRSATEGLLPVGRYGSSPDDLAEGLAGAVGDLLREHGTAAGLLAAVGIACPGLFRSDGSAIVVANLPVLKDANLPELLGTRLEVPVGIANDADAGGLAEWSLARAELLYWVFGGGWGGAWISEDGRVLHASLDWDGEDASLHYTNEPGFAVPLLKTMLHELFSGVGASYERFERICVEDVAPPGGEILGPSRRADCIRAETVLSGPGRWRIFRALAKNDRSFESRLSDEELDRLEDSGAAGEVISRLGGLGTDAAVRTDTLFGRILAEAARLIWDQAERDGLGPDVPVCVAGGPSRALSLFGPAAHEAMREKGVTSGLRPSRMEKEGRNANLLGAAVIAAKLAGGGSKSA